MKTKTFLLALLFLNFISEISFAQITFQKTYGGNGNEGSNSVLQTTDGGYFITGYSNSFVAGDYNIYLIKTNVTGDTLWTKSYGGINDDLGASAWQTTDGGYIITGFTASFGAGYDDAFLLKINSTGNMLWAKTYGGFGDEAGSYVQQTNDGGYIIVGSTAIFNPAADVYLIKTDSVGDTLWTREFGNLYENRGNFVQQTSDGGYIISGSTKTSTNSYVRIFVIKTNAMGDTMWTKSYGGTDNAYSNSIQQTNDGGFVMTGFANGAGNVEAYLLKTNVNGDILWSKTYGGTNIDGGLSVKQTSDGGFILSGYTFSFGAGSDDVYLIKTDSLGDTLWTKTFGGISEDGGNNVHQTNDGGYITSGGAASFGSINGDIYLIKTDSMGNSGCNQTNTSTIIVTSSIWLQSAITNVFSGGTQVNLVAINNNGSGFISNTLCTSVGIQSAIRNPRSEISISPNPFYSSTALTIPRNLFNDNLTLSIFSMDGRILRKQNITFMQTIIKRNGLAAGIYFYKISDKEVDKVAGKLVIQ